MQAATVNQRTEGEPPPRRRYPDQAAEHLSVGLFGVVWLFYVTPSSGGFHDVRTAAGLVAALPALVLTRPWERLGATPLALGGGLSAGGLLVLSVTPTGWAQADSLAAHVAGVVAFLVTAAYATTAARRTGVLIVLMAAVIVQFAEAWLAWWGSADPNHLMVGTFFWHNQLGIYMTALGLAAVPLALAGVPRLRLPALLVVPFAATAVVLTTSRTSLAILLGGWLAAAALIGQSPFRRWAVARWLLMPVVTIGLLLFLTNGFFFPNGDYKGPSAVRQTAAVTSPAGERGLTSLAGNGGDRIAWSRAAFQGWTAAPLVGEGFDSFLHTSSDRLPAGATTSRFVHNAYAEALASGGLAFGGPVIAGAALLLALAVRGGLRSLRGRTRERSALAGSCLASGALLLHASLDFDWHYASLLATAGILGGLTFALQRRPGPPRALPPTATVAGLFFVVAIGATAAYVEHHGRAQSRQVHADAAQEVTRLLDAGLPGAYDPRLSVAALRLTVGNASPGPPRLTVPPALAERVLAGTARIARLDRDTALRREELISLLQSTP